MYSEKNVSKEHSPDLTILLSRSFMCIFQKKDNV